MIASIAAVTWACGSAPPDGSLPTPPASGGGDEGARQGTSPDDAAAAPSAPATDAGPANPGSGSAPPAGTTDAAGAPMPASDSGPAGSCPAGAACQDFEDLTLGPADAGAAWYVSTPSCSGTGTLAIDDSEAHSGAKSLKVAGAAGYCNHIFLGTSAPSKIPGTLWLRFYVRLTTALTSDHATFLAMNDSASSSDLRMGGQDGVLMYNRSSDDATLPEMSPAGTALSLVPTVAQWHCVESAIDGAAATIQTWVDGAAVAGLVVGPGASSDADGQWARDTSWHPTLTDARFGWESYAGESETLWFDDLALGPARIGCD